MLVGELPLETNSWWLYEGGFMINEFLVEPGSNIQVEIDRAGVQGGGKVTLLPGMHMSGTIYLKSNVELHLSNGAVLTGSLNLDDYPNYYHDKCTASDGYTPEKSRKALIIASNAENIAITGNGLIDSRGPEFYVNKTIPEGGCHWPKPDFPRPRLLQLVNCRNVKLEDVSFKDSPGWSFWLVECSNMVIRGITLTGEGKMINNDGIHLDSCCNVRISDCYVNTGDDSIVVRAIPKYPGHRPVSTDIAVTNCTLTSTCQCVRIGCPLDGDIRDVVFSNLIMKGRNGINFNNPLHYATFRPEIMASGVSLLVERVLFSNIIVEVNNIPITMNIAPELSLRKLGGVSFDHIRMIGGKPCEFYGSPQTMIEDVSFSNVDFDQAPVFCNCRNIRMFNCRAAGESFAFVPSK